MSGIFTIKRNDTSPSIEYTLTPTSTDLTGASVMFKMRVKNGGVKVTQAATVLTATTTPKVGYTWGASDTDTAGEYEAEFEVTYAGGAIETFPNNGFISVRIVEDV